MMAQSLQKLEKNYCSLCNGFYAHGIYSNHLNTKYHKYATCENDSQDSVNTNMIPIAGTKVYCTKCCLCYNAMQGHDCEYKESDQKAIQEAIANCTVNDRPLFRSFRYHRQNYIICLMCATVKMEMLEDHLGSQEHKDSMIDNHKQVRLEQFHLFFIGSNLHSVESFIPNSFESVQCLKCMDTIHFNKVTIHINCVNNSFRVTDVCSKFPVNKLYHWNNKLDYDKRILDMFYPKKLMKIVFKFDKTPVYVAQKTAGSIKCLFCCVEGIIGDEQVVDHFTSYTHLMNSNNIVYNQALSTYHQFFAMSGVGDQMRHHLFEPSTLSGVTCLICQSVVVLSQIKTHNCSQQSSSNSGCSGVEVDEETMNKMIIDFSEGEVFQKTCLCCGSIFSSDRNASEHVKTPKHLNTLKENLDAVNAYLEFWGKERPKEQKYFVPLNVSQFKCIECKHPVSKSQVFRHTRKCIPSMYQEQPKIYSESVMKALYPTAKTFKECDIQMRSNFPYCLYCRVTVHGSVEKHYKNVQHVRALETPRTVSMVELYHNHWMYLSEDVQLQQICYNPVDLKTVSCVWCQISLPYQKVVGHNCMKLTVDDFKLLTGQLAYSPKVMEELYPHGNFELQKSGNMYICLFCNVNATGSPKVHAIGKPHRNKVQSRERVGAVLKYHRFWLSGDEEHQMEQLKYAPFDDTCMQCLTCRLVHSCDVLKTHRCDVPLQKARVRYDESTITTVYPHLKMNDPISKFTVQRIDKNVLSCLYCRVRFAQTTREHCRTTRHKGKAKLALWISALNAYHQYWLGSSSPDDQIHFTTHSQVNMRCTRCDVVLFFKDVATHECPNVKGPTPPINVYCSDVLYSIYPHLESERLEDLFIQKLDEKSYRCLYCSLEIKLDWERHAKKHSADKGSAKEDYLNRSVQRYHKFWVSQSGDIQMKQVNYLPYDMENAMCGWCGNVLPYERNIVKHKCTESGESSAPDVAERGATSFDIGPVRTYEGPSKVHDLVKTLLYPKHLDAAVRKSHLQFKFPIFHNQYAKKQFVQCMLCTKQVENGKEVRHLNLEHPTLDRGLVSQAMNVIAYHKHFENQPIEKHYLQSFFLPGGTRSANCLRLHKVQFSKLEFHYTKCAKYNERRLQSAMKNHDNPNQAEEESMKDNDCHEMVAVQKGQFPVRLQYQSDFFREEKAPSTKVHCKYCEVDLEDFSDVFLHIVDSKHSELLSTKQKFLYRCDICCYNSKNESDWQKHFASSGHINVFENVGKVRQTTLKEFECNVCTYVLYGDALSVFEHKEGFSILKPKNRRKNREQNDKKLSMIFGKEEYTEQCLEEIRADCLPVNCPAVELCLQEISEHLQKKYPNCKLYPFGSRAIEIGNESSDLDLFADMKNCYHGGAFYQQQAIVRDVSKHLKTRPELFTTVFSIPTARTPIVRFVHANTQVHCDLSFMNGLSVENTKFIKFCYDLQPVGRDAVLLLRRFGNIESLYAEYKICSYAFSMMLLFYMQTKGWLLSVDRLRSLTNTDVELIDGWPIIDYTKSVEELKHYVEEYTGSVYSLLKEFFKFYSGFNFEEDVVCPLMGSVVKRKQFNKQGKDLPSEMSVYKENVKSESFRFEDCFMCVQDPFDLSHNLTKAVSNDSVASFKFKCRNVHKMFS